MRLQLLLVCFVAVSLPCSDARAQQKPSPTKVSEAESQSQEPIKIYVEEVRIPLRAYDTNGHFEPGVEASDLMLREDGVPQHVTSVYRVPANVLLLLDTGGELNLAKSVKLTRETARYLIKNLAKEDQVALLQVNNQVELIQEWTRDRSRVSKSLDQKLISGKRSKLTEGVATAIELLRKMPAGSRNLVLISDGLDSGQDESEFSRAIETLTNEDIITHVISYTALGLARKKPPISRPREKTMVPKEVILSLPRFHMPGDPRPDMVDMLEAKGGTTISIDRLFQHRTELKKQLALREEEFSGLASETGGYLSLPADGLAMIQEAGDVATAIDSEYIVSYRPQNSSSGSGLHRKIEITSRRVGLQLSSRRSYVRHPQIQVQ